MYTNDKMAFLQIVGEQIRWKKAQPILLQELEHHIIDQTLAFMEDGFNEDKATKSAIRQMGDPVAVGEELNRIHKPKPDWIILTLIAGIIILGLAIHYVLIPFYDSYGGFDYGRTILMSQLRGVFFGVVAMFVAYFLDFSMIGKYYKALFLFLSLACVYTILFGIQVNGAYVHGIYPLLLYPVVYVGIVYNLRNKGYSGLILSLLGFLIPAFIAIILPSTSAFLILSITCSVVLFTSAAKGWFNVNKITARGIAIMPVLIFIFNKGYMILSNHRYHITDYLVNVNKYTSSILSKAHLIGGVEPIGKMYQFPGENFYLNDYVITYFIHSFGWIPFIGFMILLALLISKLFHSCIKQKSLLGYLTSLSIITVFTIQCIIYIMANLGFQIFTPLSLPLVSYGVKSFVLNMFLLGLLLSVFRTGDYIRDSHQSGITPFLQFEKGRIIINLK